MPCEENFLRKKIKLDRVLIMDDVLGLADKSETFANFLTVSRKSGLTCTYVFHTIYPTIKNWQIILAQTKIFNIFPGSIETSSIAKNLCSFCSRYKYNYLPSRETSGLRDCTLTYQIQLKRNVGQ